MAMKVERSGELELSLPMQIADARELAAGD
jgi:hypothetical protein